MPAAPSSRAKDRHIFISHSSEDAAVAEKVCRALESAGLATWICSRDIQPGQTWAGAISDGLERSGALVLLFTESANRSEYVLREVNLAVKQKVPILPIRLDETPISKDMEFYIDVAHWISVSDGQIDPHLDKITDGCRNLFAPRAAQFSPTATRRKKAGSSLAAASGPNILVPRHHAAATPDAILRLVERFEQHREAYKAGTYTEAHVRRDFIDPFFTELGWDVNNRAGYAEAYRDVIHEDSVKVAGSLRAPDYGFRIGGQRKFFLEAKKPSIRVKQEIDPAYQLRRYAWSAKLPVSVLTDFEEFAVYDCRLRPLPNDPASKNRIIYYTFDSYPERWEEIASVFAKDAVLRGSFDKFATTAKGKRGTSEVDDEFLATIEEWRADLARNLALRNALLSQRKINFAVQRIIDRIIFLRICEDRGSEDYGRLRRLSDSKDIYPQLVALFRQADTRYNSGLFHFSAERGRLEAHDTLTPGLSIDDALLKKIIRGLYYPDSPYQFDVISADILGQVYEQFLGKVIRLTDNHQAKIEEKPEVKKAGGVYYTPTYIVDYIVKESVGPLIEEKTPKQIADIRVLDPACGSGSFLIGAYQFLLDWYLRYYTSNEPERWAKGKNPALVPGRRGGWVLSIPERKHILTAHIHGVDIDSQAVEVTKLSLLLKVLEGETALNLQPELIQERVLPDLTDNIKCGNSLIGSDFYAQPDLPEMDGDARLKINVFDWDGADGFPEIMKNGGFDAVIGNPPYVRQETIKETKAYLAKHFESFEGTADLFTYFMERGVKLLRQGGRFGIIVSSGILRANFAKSLRRILKKEAAVRRIVDFGGLAVFTQAKDTYVCIPILERGAAQDTVSICKIAALAAGDLDEQVTTRSYSIPHERLTEEAWSLQSDHEANLLRKILTRGTPLGVYVEGKMFYGLKTGLNEAFVISDEVRDLILRRSPTAQEVIHSFAGGQDIRRYTRRANGDHIVVLPSGFTRAHMQKEGLAQPSSEADAWKWIESKYAAVSEHLQQFEAKLRKREDQGDFWWELRPCDYYNVFETPKIVFPDICKGPRFHLDEEGTYIGNTAYCLGTADPYLLGFLNSKLFWFAISSISIPFGVRAGKFRYRLIYQYMEKVPVPVLETANKAHQEARSRITNLVEMSRKLHRELELRTTPHESTALERQITSIDNQIDKEFYTLF